MLIPQWNMVLEAGPALDLAQGQWELHGAYIPTVLTLISFDSRNPSHTYN